MIDDKTGAAADRLRATSTYSPMPSHANEEQVNL
jgi:hypothetical protein